MGSTNKIRCSAGSNAQYETTLEATLEEGVQSTQVDGKRVND